MATLTGTIPKDTYPLLLKVDSGGLDGTLRNIEDGDATGSALSLSTGKVGVNGLLAYGAEIDLTISAGGAVAVTKTYHSIIVNGGTGSGADDLLTATGGSEGDILILKSNTSGGSDTVTVKNGTGADTFILSNGADFILDHVDDRIMFIHNGTEWVEISRSSNS